MIQVTSWMQIKTHPCFSFLELAFSCTGQQSHSPPIAVSCSITGADIGGQEDHTQGKGEVPKHPSQGQSRMSLAHSDLQKCSEGYSPMGIAVLGVLNLHPWPFIPHHPISPPVTACLPVGPHSESVYVSD